MHVTLIVDEEHLRHEQTTLNRLSIGLIGEGVRITRVIPETPSGDMLEAGEQRVALAARFETPMHVLPWMRRWRAGQLRGAMERSLPDVLFAIGEDAWAVGIDLARAMDRPLAIEVSTATQVRRAPRRRAAAAVAGYIVPTEPMASALRQRVDPALVCLVPLGVAVPASPRVPLADPERSIGLAIIGGGRDVPAYRAVLAGLRRVVRDMPQIQIILELSGPNEHEIWRHAERLELLENLSTITHASQHRALITQCDLLLMPERFGELRSLTLEAMAVGIPIIASDDPFLDMLIDGESVSVVHDPDPEAWAQHVRRYLTDPEAARALGLEGRDYVARRHRSSDQVMSLINVFQRLAAGGAFPFSEAAPG